MKTFWMYFQPLWNTPDNPTGGAPAADPAPNPTGGAPAVDPAAEQKFPTLKPGTFNDPANPGNGNNPPANPDPSATPPALLGAPEGGQYADFTMPEGMTADPTLLGKFTPLAKEFGLSQAGAQKIIDFYNKEIVGPQSAAFVEQVQTWFGETEKDPEIGGAKFEASVAAAGKALSTFGTKGLRTLLLEYGLGNHPEVVRFFTRVGNSFGEDTAAGSGKAPAAEKDFLTLMYGPNPKAGQQS